MFYDLIIIGADMAGLTAAVYAGRKKLNTAVITAKIGGQTLMTSAIENFPGFIKISGAEIVSLLKKQVEKTGVPVVEEEVVFLTKEEGEKFLVKTKDGEYFAKTVIVASGAKWRKLNIPGEEKFIGRGVSFCSICDAPFFEGKDVAVVGGGNSGFDSAFDLLKYASKIYVLEISENFAGDKATFEKLKESGKVEFINFAKALEIKGGENVESVCYEDVSKNEKKEISVGGVFVNIGLNANSSFAEGFLELNSQKEIIIDPRTNASSVEGVFAAGDVADNKYKQAVIAAGDGARAVLSAYEYLKRKGFFE
ncbi:MAG: FAD-dependent oxidoreductase [Candidatus Pacebacteria bacterium]|nr:FAD-dependent oxidoreductase [Candidatus Paceibacterota bacterium]